jgi:hypothetical protein
VQSIVIGEFKVNGVESASTLGVGHNLLIGIRAAGKTQVGHGVIFGDFSAMPSLGSSIADPDLIDSPMLTVWGAPWYPV